MERLARTDVSSWAAVADETAGAEVKLWLEDPEGHRWLYKPVVVKRGHRQGEDWSEVIASDVAGLLGLPCAMTALARFQGEDGSISRNLRPPEYELVPGYIWMLAMLADTAYIPGRDADCPRWRPGHSLANLQQVLEGVLPPPDCTLPRGFTAFDVFVGYLILDAIIANRDRHDENWSVLWPESPADDARLCGTYDHASSLGFNLTDRERIERLSGSRGGVDAWVQRGTAWRFEHDPDRGPVTLVDLAVQALGLSSLVAAQHWKALVRSLSLDRAHQHVADLADLSEPCRNFVGVVLDLNLRRIRDELDRHR